MYFRAYEVIKSLEESLWNLVPLIHTTREMITLTTLYWINGGVNIRLRYNTSYRKLLSLIFVRPFLNKISPAVKEYKRHHINSQTDKQTAKNKNTNTETNEQGSKQRLTQRQTDTQTAKTNNLTNRITTYRTNIVSILKTIQ